MRTKKFHNTFILGLCFVFVLSCKTDSQQKDIQTKEDTATVFPDVTWTDLFNGADMESWIPKISGETTGVNFKNTFVVKDSVLQVNYDEYSSFENHFGHLFYERPFSAYFLIVEYRFYGEQMPDMANWAWKNSGVMLHSQSPESMTDFQDFPISLEGQLLGGDESNLRSTLNLCTPGTTVEIDGLLEEEHCIPSTGPNLVTDDWTRVGFLVLKDSVIQHLWKGKPVITYTKPKIDGTMINEFDQNKITPGTSLSQGYISLQSESHPIQFRKVSLVDLEPFYENKKVLGAVIDTLLSRERKMTGR